MNKALPRSSTDLGLFVLSAAILTLEILETRLFAYCLPPILLYGAIGLTLLGLGAAGSLLALWPGWRSWRLGSVGAFAAGMFAITAVAAHALFARTSDGLVFELMRSLDANGRALAVCAALAMPYFFGGLAVTACLASSGAGIHRSYLVNLLGSAAGCFGVALLLKPLTAPVLLGAVCLLAVAGGALFARGGAAAPAKVTLALGAAIAAVATAWPSAFYAFNPDVTGQLPALRAVASTAPNVKVREVYSAWDLAARVEFHAFDGWPAGLPEPIETYFYSQDGSAGSVVFGVGDDVRRGHGLFDRTLYGAGYALHGAPRGARVLIIGLGGGPDMLGAHYFGAGEITGVDINGSAIEAIAGPLAAFSGNLYARPGVRVERIDGRTFVRSTRETYDLIVMSGADTKSVGAAGALATSENHLYTVEGFVEYLSRLRPNGVIALLRFGDYDRLKLASIGVAALRRIGAAHPEAHFAVLEQGLWNSVLLCRDPVPDERLAALRQWAEAVPPTTGIAIPYYDLIGLGFADAPKVLHPAAANGSDVGAFFAAVARGEEVAYVDALEQNYSPTTDDRPFFFDGQRRDRLLASPGPAYVAMGWFLVTVSVLALAFIALPVPLFLRRRTGAAPLGRTLVYFGALGAGFMVLEIGLIQKLVLFLGHQSYAITVVLATLLVGAGLGSLASGRFRDGARAVRRVVVPCIIAGAWAIVLTLDLFGGELASLPLGARLALATAALFPLGFCLGMPFPTALAGLATRSPGIEPWAIAANGFTSVVGSALALPLAMLLGYRAVLAAACVIYVVAALSFPAGRPGRPAAG
jgi:spermidine synthase